MHMKKRWFSLFLAFCMVLSLLPFGVLAADVVDGGQCGDNVSWTLDSDGLLTVTGSGRMDSPDIQNRDAVIEIVIESGVENIASYAFEGCGNLTTVRIPASVQRTEYEDGYEYGAFLSCPNLTDIYYGGTAEAFSAFDRGLEERNHALIHASDATFYDRGVCGDDLSWIVDEDCVLTVSGTGDMADWPNFGDDVIGAMIGSAVIGDGVTHIGSETFHACTNMASVSLPASVTSIGDNAFAGAESLSDVSFGGTIDDFAAFNLPIDAMHYALVTASDGSFLNSGYCGEQVIWVLDEDFGLTIRGTGDMSGWQAFQGNENVTSVVIEDGVTRIEDSAFSGCRGMTSITIPASVTSIGGGAFQECVDLADVYFAGTSAQFAAFGLRADQLNYAAIHTSDSTFVDSGACGDDLTWTLDAEQTLTIRGTGEMWDSPEFPVREDIVSVVIESGVTHIGSGAFWGFESLYSVAIPASVMSVGENPFSDCNALEKISFSGTAAQYAALGLRPVDTQYAVVNASDDSFLGFGPCGDDLTWKMDADRAITVSGMGAMWDDPEFHADPGACSVVFENGVTAIGHDTFTYCNELTDISLPDSVTTIGSSAFYNCDALESVTIPAAVTTIEGGAFADCDALSDVYYGGTSAQLRAMNLDLWGSFSGARIHTADGTYNECGDALTWSVDAEGNLVILGTGEMWWFPEDGDYEQFQGNPDVLTAELADGVTTIGHYAFRDCANLETVTIPASVERIDEGAFSGCTALADVYFGGTTAEFIRLNTPASMLNNAAIHTADGDFTLTDPYGVCGDQLYWTVDGTTLTVHGTGAMWDDHWYDSMFDPADYGKIRSVVIEPGATSIGSCAFHDFEYMMNLTIPATVTRIGNDAFSNCGRLTSVYITDLAAWCAITFEDNPLYSASKLYVNGSLVTDLVIPSGATVVSDNAFASFTAITSVTIPEGVTRIGKNAFGGCTGIVTVSLPSSAKVIDEYAFNDCTALESAEIPSGVTTIGHSAFRNCVSLATLTLGEGLKTIGGYAFSNCDALTELTLPAGVEQVDDYAFETCDALKIVKILGYDTWLGNNVFYVCYELRDLLYVGTQDQWEDNGNRFCGLGDDARIHYGVTDFDDHIRETVVEPTCTESGYTTCECPCGYAFEQSDYTEPLGHETELRGAVEPTCTEPGYSGDLWCTRCEEVIEYGEEIDPLGHDWGEWTVTQEATPTQPGVETRVCSRCSATETRNLVRPIVAVFGDNVVYVSGEVRCPFVPELDGVYRFIGTTPDSDTYLTLYDADGNVVGENDDSAGDGQFQLDSELTAGETYYLGLRFYNEGTEGLISFRVTARPPEIVGQTVNVLCSTEDTGDFEVEAIGLGLTYQWQYRVGENGTWRNNSSATQGYNTPKLTVAGLSGGTNRNGFQYRCVVTDIAGQTVYSAPATFRVMHPVVIVSEPQSVVATVGDTAEFTVGATGDELSYQWQFCAPGKDVWNNSGMTGNNTPTLSVPVTAARNGQRYRCIVSNPVGERYSIEASLSVVSKPVITLQPESITANTGETVYFTAAATGADLTYQWQYKSAGTTKWYNSGMPGATTPTLEVEALAKRNGQQYRCKISNAVDTVYTEAATLTVLSKPVITAQPQNVSTSPGETVTFTVTATGADLQYQWQYKAPGTSKWYNSGAAGSKTPTLTVEATAARNGQQYRCKVTNANGEAFSNAAKLTVLSQPVITVQPKSAAAAYNDVVRFTVQATGGSLTYQWQYKSPSASAWKDSSMTGAKTATLKVTALAARNGQQYRCVVRNAAGEAVSEPATLTAAEQAVPLIMVQPSNKTASPGDTVKFTVQATGGDLTYQWQFKAPGTSTWYNSGAAGAKTASLEVAATTARNGQQYRCIVTNALGTVTSDAAKLTVK